MSPIRPLSPETPVGRSEQTGTSKARVVRNRGTRLIPRRVSGRDNLQGYLPGVASKPNGGKSAETQFVDNPVPIIIIEHIAEIHRAKAPLILVFKMFVFAQLKQQVFPRLGSVAMAMGLCWYHILRILCRFGETVAQTHRF